MNEDRVRAAAKYVYDAFMRSEQQGYRTKDRRFAIDILGQALGLPLYDAAVAGAAPSVAEVVASTDRLSMGAEAAESGAFIEATIRRVDDDFKP